MRFGGGGSSRSRTNRATLLSYCIALIAAACSPPPRAQTSASEILLDLPPLSFFPTAPPNGRPIDCAQPAGGIQYYWIDLGVVVEQGRGDTFDVYAWSWDSPSIQRPPPPPPPPGTPATPPIPIPRTDEGRRIPHNGVKIWRSVAPDALPATLHAAVNKLAPTGIPVPELCAHLLVSQQLSFAKVNEVYQAFEILGLRRTFLGAEEAEVQ